AADVGLKVLDAAGAGLSAVDVLTAWDGFGAGEATAAIEIDRTCLESADELRALFLRAMGVVHSFTGENDAAMATFNEALEGRLSPERRAHFHMFRALSLIKRMGHFAEAREEADRGLRTLVGRSSPEQALQEAWLRNVKALTFFQERKLEEAVQEETRAIHCLADLRSASATHLKINLITNLSAIHEGAGRYAHAVGVWRKFEKTLQHWDANFHKHHRFRLAALHRLNGDVSQADVFYREAYARGEELDDAFSCQVMAMDLGMLHAADGNGAEAVNWFLKSSDRARTYGDPLAVAEALAAAGLESGGEGWAEAQRLAAASSTHPHRAERLGVALKSGDRQTVAKLLPKAKSKLNRPFDLVNLY
ncbi:MAG TPA: tetratricopeptide repeat protein, partial [Myxococcaceae bacterium]|nr:tetratricopeptide repeat protein [Myxococcaceae bacterium]